MNFTFKLRIDLAIIPRNYQITISSINYYCMWRAFGGIHKRIIRPLHSQYLENGTEFY